MPFEFEKKSGRIKVIGNLYSVLKNPEHLDVELHANGVIAVVDKVAKGEVTKGVFTEYTNPSGSTQDETAEKIAALFNTSTLDYGLELAKGNIPGETGIQIAGRSELVGTSWSDIWGLGGEITHATSGETWEIVSSSADDAAAGIGARTVVVQYLDDAYVLQTEVKTMNGTTPVTFTAIDALRFRMGVALTYGSTNENQGVITIRVSGVGASRGSIDLSSTYTGAPKGFNVSLDSHYTIEAGKTLFPTSAIVTINKGFDVATITQFKLFGSDAWISLGEIPQYQATGIIPFDRSLVAVPEKTDIRAIAISANTPVVVNFDLFGILLNEVVDTSSSSSALQIILNN